MDSITITLKGWTKGAVDLFKYTGEQDELENFVQNRQNLTFKNTYLGAMKKAGWFSIIGDLLTLSIYLLLYGFQSEEQNDFMISLVKFFVGGLMFLFVLTFYPDKTQYMIPLFIFFVMGNMHDICMISDQFKIDEFMMPTLGFIHVLVMIIPTQWLNNWIAYTASMIYFIYGGDTKYGGIPSGLSITSFLGSFWFFVGNLVLYSKLKELYNTILQNEKLIKEMKKILQIFPHGVLITPKDPRDGQQSHFTNEAFEREIVKIKHKLNELDFLQVEFKEDKGVTAKTFKKTLDEFIHQQQSNVTRSNSMVELDVKLFEKSDIANNRHIEENKFERNNEDNLEVSKRSFLIKSLEVEWDSSPGFMHVFIDTTGIVNLEKAKTNIKYQKIMFASVSHEFRTPLNAIMNSFQFIEDQFNHVLLYFHKFHREDLRFIESNAERIKKFIEIGSNSSTLLMNLIEDILDMSKIEAGTFVINNTNFSLNAMIEEIKNIFAYQGKQKRIKLIVEVQRELQMMDVYSDKGRLRQILLNLISNSLKFTFEGSISLVVRQDDKNGDKILLFKVIDTGIGIREEDKPMLFKLFGMINEARELNPNGTGIGLSICKKYGEKLGGEIDLKSTYKKGTEVYFWVPLVEANIPQTGNLDSSIGETDSKFIDESIGNTREVRSDTLKKFICLTASKR